MLPAYQREMWKMYTIKVTLYVPKYIQLLAKARDFSLLCNILTSSAVKNASYLVGSGACFFWSKSSSTWSWPLTFI